MTADRQWGRYVSKRKAGKNLWLVIWVLSVSADAKCELQGECERLGNHQKSQKEPAAQRGGAAFGHLPPWDSHGGGATGDARDAGSTQPPREPCHRGEGRNKAAAFGLGFPVRREAAHAHSRSCHRQRDQTGLRMRTLGPVTSSGDRRAEGSGVRECAGGCPRGLRPGWGQVPPLVCPSVPEGILGPLLLLSAPLSVPPGLTV